ncbi:MarR family winged helix-turn-helix transcriptional regulator [Rhodovulum sp. PH10]|uniref:MarR family winged helix-turn-helix transcriptional regulator n=1 Tax=Rhodovulum sp. PH10 TaxID=1187851 RepID=UPI001ED97E94|nr:MarR family winged helix-turn-helix transcriptional regulator [Rhodovulum sp. PH10]
MQHAVMKSRFHQNLTPAGEVLTELMLETFRLNGRLLAAGDRLVAPLGLTSARWQILGAIALAGNAQPVAHIARDMGLARQSVQRVVDELAREKLVAFADNPHHRRAKLVALTEHGAAAYRDAIAAHAGWSNALAEDLSAEEIGRALVVLTTLREKLERAHAAQARARKTSLVRAVRARREKISDEPASTPEGST